MKVAILADIHGNSEALQAVLSDKRFGDVARTLVLGDYVGYYFDPELVLRSLAELDAERIGGNHESILKKSLTDLAYRSEVRKKYGSGIEYAIQKLTKVQIEELVLLPKVRYLNLSGREICLAHGSPWSESEYIYPNSSPDVLERCLDSPASIVFIGHNHRQFLFRKGSSLLASVGSVGQNREQGGVASWAIFDTGEGSVALLETAYDVTSLVERVSEIDREIAYNSDVLVRKKEF